MPIRAPKGTRDAYPEDVLRRRYITNAWRDVAVRHGFEEIEGPTFELSDLYAVKSGDGILSELFQAFSGKDPAERAAVQETGRAPYALRPEFTPTLARMYVSKFGKKGAGSVTRWFTAGPYFRAERPQRGRLREFLQWNCDILGGDDTQAETHDAQLLAVLRDLIDTLGLAPDAVRPLVSWRPIVRDGILRTMGELDEAAAEALLPTLDAAKKMPFAQLQATLEQAGLAAPARDLLLSWVSADAPAVGVPFSTQLERLANTISTNPQALASVAHAFQAVGIDDWAAIDLSIVRGLAYYTGTVFELIANDERAVAGGGRYDNLIQLFNGPPTPACGFGMGDVVLNLLLQDHDRIPERHALMEAVSQHPASLRPEAYIAAPDQSRDLEAAELTTQLRRGQTAENADPARPWARDRYAPQAGGRRPIHARRPDKATRNVGKLFKDALAQNARLFVVLESDGSATIQDLDRKTKAEGVEHDELPNAIRDRLTR